VLAPVAGFLRGAELSAEMLNFLALESAQEKLRAFRPRAAQQNAFFVNRPRGIAYSRIDEKRIPQQTCGQRAKKPLIKASAEDKIDVAGLGFREESFFNI
jgi:hypothetical protein